MIKVKIEKEKSIQRIVIKGHAMYDEMGKDIVCAGVSAIITTTINGILKINSSLISYQVESGYIEIKVCQESEIVNILLENMIDLLIELRKKYKKNIKIEEVAL